MIVIGELPVTQITFLGADIIDDRTDNGASGAVISGATTSYGRLVLLAASVAVTLSVSPLACGGLSAIASVPFSGTGPDSASVLPLLSLIVIVLPGSAVAVRVVPSAEMTAVGGCGAVVSGAVTLAGVLL